MKNYHSLAAHNSVCNEFFYKVQDCQYEHPFGKFVGYCNDVEKEMRKCIKEQRQINRGINREIAKRRSNKVLEVQQKEEKREQASH